MKKSNKKEENNIPKKILGFGLEKKELLNQLNLYETLNFSKSARKISAGLLILSSVLTLFFAPNFIFDSLILLTLSFFVYRGSKRAIIVAIIYWTFAKLLQLFEDPEMFFVIFLWWSAYMHSFWSAYQVERAREKLTLEKYNNHKKINRNKIKEKKEKGKKFYCDRCGLKLGENSKFCSKCGSKIS